MKKINRPEIFLRQTGFSPDSIKRAVIPFQCEDFQLTDKEGNMIFRGKTRHFGTDPASRDDVYIADFTEFTTCGSYKLYAEGRSSVRFGIAPDSCKDVCRDTLRSFYYLRCGCGLDMANAGLYEHAPCHTAPAVLWEDNSVSLDVSGGWHDAGDYGRYVTAGAVALAHMLYGYKLFPEGFSDIRTNIPDSRNDMPDLLTECKTELLWIMKMQREDGGVYHKATTKGHAPFIMPEEDKGQMYVLPVSSMATADTAAVCALAAGIYEDFDSELAGRLRGCAERAYEFLQSNPEQIFDPTPECTTGGYGERSDRDNRCWAAAELYALTGEKRYHEDFLTLIKEDFPKTALGWGEVGGFASLAYMLCGYERDDEVCKMLRDAFADEAERLAEKSRSCGYGAAIGENEYFWGSNMKVLVAAMTFIIASRLCGKTELLEYAEKQIDYILGCNAVGISYISGSGEYSVNSLHYRPAAADGIDKCHEGFVSGGPNSHAGDYAAKKNIPEGTPPMKCFADVTECYSLNENAIYWNSPAVFVLGYLHSIDVRGKAETQ